MKVLKFKTEEEWLEARRGRITGTRLKDLISKRGNTPKIGYYELIAERIALPPNDENVMDRGIRLEDEAIAKFAKITGKKVNNDLVMWVREDDPNIAISPDGSIGKNAAVEVKCLSSAQHIKALMTKEIPEEYRPQSLQYFIVNDKLKTLYFVFYDPRMPKDLFWIEVTRKSVEKEVKEYLELEKQVLREVGLVENDLTF